MSINKYAKTGSGGFLVENEKGALQMFSFLLPLLVGKEFLKVER